MGINQVGFVPNPGSTIPGVMIAQNADFSQASPPGQSANILDMDGELWIGSTALNAGGTHVNVGKIVAADASMVVGYSGPNITLRSVGTGDVIGPASSINNDIAVFSGVTGKLIADSGVKFPIPVSSGGTGLTTLTAHSIQIGNTTSTPTQLTVGATGTVLIGNTGADPSFSANPTITSVTFGAGQALSTYEEGIFTPTIDGSTPGTTTYVGQNGYYVKVGKLVTAYAFIQISSATGTGNAILAGLPYSFYSNTQAEVPGIIQISGAWAWPAATTALTTRGNSNATTMSIFGIGTTLTTAQLQMTNAACIFRFSVTYRSNT